MAFLSTTKPAKVVFSLLGFTVKCGNTVQVRRAGSHQNKFLDCETSHGKKYLADSQLEYVGQFLISCCSLGRFAIRIPVPTKDFSH